MVQGVKIASQIGLLYIIYMIGRLIQHTFALPIPGSIIGMTILFILLMTNRIKATWIQDGSSWMMKHLVLFFIPATVGIIGYFSFFSGKGSLLVLIVLVSTALVLVISGITGQFVVQRKEMNND